MKDKLELKAPSMVERWRMLNDTHSITERAARFIYNWITFSIFARHMMSKLHLWQLIPCGKDGKPLEKPSVEDYYLEQVDEETAYPVRYDDEEFQIDMEEYQEAEARVIYQGFEMLKYNDDLKTVFVRYNGKTYTYQLRHNLLDRIKTHEELQRLGVYFTEEKAKKFKIV